MQILIENPRVYEGVRMISGELELFWKSFQSESEFDAKSFLDLYKETDEKTVLRILAQFRETLNTTLLVAKEALTQDQADELWKAFHKIAGSAELLGFKSFGDSARDLSHQIKANPDVHCHEPEIRNLLNWTNDLIQKISTGCPSLSNHLS